MTNTQGSPPRMRGKVAAWSSSCKKLGITPACAGKSRSQPRLPCIGRDHPRVCGEKESLTHIGALGKGSPPRVRGKARDCNIDDVHFGITPACAGKRGIACSCRNSRGDHPRACGEKFHPASDRKLGRVRGTKRSSGPAPAAAPAGLAGSCPASPPWSYPPRITVSRPRP